MRMDRKFLRAGTGKLLVWALAVLLLSACQRRELLPQPAYPLSAEVVSDALADQGLDWTVWQTNSPSSSETTHILLRPESGKTYGDAVITTGETGDRGRYLGTMLLISKDDLDWPLEEPHGWEEWKDIFLLSARLYGGFEGEEELYEACAGTELPLDERILYEGELSGCCCRVSVSTPIQDWPPYHDGTHSYTLSLELWETEDSL